MHHGWALKIGIGKAKLSRTRFIGLCRILDEVSDGAGEMTISAGGEVSSTGLSVIGGNQASSSGTARLKWPSKSWRTVGSAFSLMVSDAEVC